MPKAQPAPFHRWEQILQVISIHHTWDTLLNWYEFQPIASGLSWGVHSAFTFRINEISGINEKRNPNPGTFSPSPCTDRITVKNFTGDEAVIVISEMQRKELIRTTSSSDRFTIPTPDLPAGLYLIKVINIRIGEEISGKVLKK